jgi:AraC family transcriptional regulator
MSVEIRQLFSSDLLGVAEFICPPGDASWRDVNVISSEAPLVVFPHLPVVIRHVDSEPVLATPNLVMLYNPGQLFERELRNADGDECLFIQLHPPAIEALEQEGGPLREGRLQTAYAPSSKTAYLHQHILGRYLRGSAPDALLVEETAIRLVRSVTATASTVDLAGQRSDTRSSHHELAESAKEILAATLAESPSLHEIAGRLNASPFHLARLFRRHTGFSLHQYRTQLRLRLALERLPESAGSLSALAFEYGFASHSHFTDTFRREFGFAPSVVRNDEQVRVLLDAA